MTKKPAKFTDEEYEAWIERVFVLTKNLKGRFRWSDFRARMQGIGIVCAR